MNIVWYNTNTLPSIHNNNHLIQITNELLRIIDKYEIDIIMLCEVFLIDDSEQLLKMLKRNLNDEWDIICKPKNEDKKFWKISSGLIVLMKSKYKPSNVKFISYQACNVQDCISNKGYWMIKLSKIWLIGTHLQDRNTLFLKERSIKKNINQQGELFQNIEYTIKGDSFIVVGDINCLPNELSNNNYQIIVPDKSTTIDGEILDYVISSSNLDIKIQVINNLKTYTSDHYPILISVNSL